MSDRFAPDTYDDRAPRRSEHDERDSNPSDEPFPPLPHWLAARHLQEGEVVEWVRGPRWAPAAERSLTHVALFLVALIAAAGLIVVGVATVGPQSELFIAPALLAVLLVFGSIMVLGFFNGYFTRLVVTNQRVLIMQGYEVVRNWGMDDLPRSMIRYRTGEQGERAPSINLDTVKTMLGGSAEGFTDAKTILAFGKQLNSIVKGRDDKTR